MFRNASIKECKALIAAAHRLLPLVKITPAAAPTSSSPSHASDAERELAAALISDIKTSMLADGLAVVLDGFRNPQIRKDIMIETCNNFTCACPGDGGSLCEECVARAEELNSSILFILERDFLQLWHGHQGRSFCNRIGVRFLLAGITLAILYRRLPPTPTMVGLVTRTLVAMLDQDLWCAALKEHGPAPKAAAMVTEARSRRTITVSARAHLLSHLPHHVRYLPSSLPGSMLMCACRARSPVRLARLCGGW